MDLFASFRVTDIFLLMAIFRSIKKIRLSMSFVLLMFWLLFSSVFSVINVGFLRYETLLFLYKFSLPVMLWYVLLHQTTKDAENSFRILRIVSVLLAVWVIFYPFLLKGGFLRGNFRPSFPFSDYSISDAHVFSNFLSFALIGHLEYWRRNKQSGLYQILVFVILLSALLFCGSRNGLLTIGLYLIIFLGTSAKRTFSAIFCFLLTIFLIQYSNIDLEIDKTLFRLLERSGDFDLSDQSSSNRLLKLRIAMDFWGMNYYFFGLGFFSSPMIWYDGLFGHLTAYFGIAIIYIFALIIKFFIWLVSKGQFTVSFLFVLYLVANFITEFYCITRSILPFMVMLMYFFKHNESSNLNTSI